MAEHGTVESYQHVRSSPRVVSSRGVVSYRAAYVSKRSGFGCPRPLSHDRGSEFTDRLGLEGGHVRKHAGVPDVSLPDCSWLCATRLIRAGVALRTVQQIMGHADVKTRLEQYNRVSDDDMREAVDKVAKLREAAGGYHKVKRCHLATEEVLLRQRPRS